MRRPRLLEKNAEYHVIARINRKEFVLEDNSIKNLFMQVLKETKKKFDFEIKNFCIMTNHAHFILKPLNDESLSKIMQWLLSVFAIRYNKIMKITGHLWHDRFKSKIIYGIIQFLKTFVYISENPVKANIVKVPEDYKYNGINYIKNKKFDIIIKPDEITMAYYNSIRDRP